MRLVNTHIRLIWFTMTVLACCCLQAGSIDKVATFSALPEGDELLITLKGEGCFSSSTYEFQFRRTNGLSVTVTQVEGIWWTAGQTNVNYTNDVRLGDLRLTRSDAEGLDRLLQFYRAGPDGGCTSVDTITIRQRHAGKIVATEQFTDGSCSYDRKDLTWLPELIFRLRKPK